MDISANTTGQVVDPMLDVTDMVIEQDTSHQKQQGSPPRPMEADSGPQLCSPPRSSGAKIRPVPLPSPQQGGACPTNPHRTRAVVARALQTSPSNPHRTRAVVARALQGSGSGYSGSAEAGSSGQAEGAGTTQALLHDLQAHDLLRASSALHDVIGTQHHHCLHFFVDTGSMFFLEPDICGLIECKRRKHYCTSRHMT